MTRARIGFLAGLFATSTLTLVVSCSLGLDESKIAEANEAGSNDANPGEETGADASDGGTEASGPDGGTCAKDEDCPTTNACLEPRCDLTAKRCIFDVCKPMACNLAACDTATKTCGAPKPYTYKVTQFQVGLPVQRMVAVYPWLFVQTSTGVIAYNVSNPINPATPNTAPPSVPVFGIGFVPTQMVATGNRVFFLAGASGPANVASRVPLAWLDVPTDPFVTRLDAKNVVTTYSRPSNEPIGLIGRENDTAFLLGGAAQNYPVTILEPPYAEPALLTGTPIVFTAGHGPAAISGTRIVLQAVDGPSGTTTFSIVTGAGTTTPMNAGNYSFADAGPVSGPQAFASSINGAVFWSIASLTTIPGQPETLTRAVRGQFLLPNGTGDYDRPSAFDVEVYSGPQVGPGAFVAGPVAMLDADTVMILAAARENPPAQTAVQFAKKNPLGIVKNADGTTLRRLVLPVPVSTFAAAAATNGIGFAAGNETMPTPNATIYVFDPNCAMQ